MMPFAYRADPDGNVLELEPSPRMLLQRMTRINDTRRSGAPELPRRWGQRPVTLR